MLVPLITSTAIPKQMNMSIIVIDINPYYNYSYQNTYLTSHVTNSFLEAAAMHPTADATSKKTPSVTITIATSLFTPRSMKN